MGNTSSEDDSVFRLPRRGLCSSVGVRAGVDGGGVERLGSARQGPPWNPGPVTPVFAQHRMANKALPHSSFMSHFAL